MLEPVPPSGTFLPTCLLINCTCSWSLRARCLQSISSTEGARGSRGQGAEVFGQLPPYTVFPPKVGSLGDLFPEHRGRICSWLEVGQPAWALPCWMPGHLELVTRACWDQVTGGAAPGARTRRGLSHKDQARRQPRSCQGPP